MIRCADSVNDYHTRMSMKRGPNILLSQKHIAENPIPHFFPFQIVHQDIINAIFSHLPKNQYLPQRLLNKRCRTIIDLRLINSEAVQDAVQKIIQSEEDQKTLFDAQQREIDCLLSNKKAILNTPKLETRIVRPDEELIKAFKELENVPQQISISSLFRRHAVLNDINLHMIFNTRDNNQLYDMFIVCKVIDFSGLYLTRLPRAIFQMYINKNLFKLPLVLNVSNNCLTQLPRSIVSLRSLRVLDLTGNQIESLPLNMNDFEYLETIFLANNCLTELPLSLVRLRRLMNIDIRRNCLQTLPEELNAAVIVSPRYTSAPLVSAHVDYAQYLKRFPILTRMSKAKVLATQKPQKDLQMYQLTKHFKK